MADPSSEATWVGSPAAGPVPEGTSPEASESLALGRTQALGEDEDDELGGAAGLAPTVPKQIGRYLILRRLGAGAMGIVLVGYDPELDRKLAIKLIHPRAAARDQARTRMLREAKGLARVSHPNVVQVYDAGTVDGRVFIAMELVDGQPLSQWQRGRSSDEILAAYLGAGRGLAAAHAAGLVHRDFKPDNVLIDGEGRARVLDFGLVRAIGKVVEHAPPGAEPSIELALDGFEAPSGGVELPRDTPELPLARARELSGATNSELDSELTHGGAVMGTPAYMSPEQWRGAAIDARSDQFSFCVALWEALHGERPFSARNPMALANAVCTGKRSEPDGAARLPGRIRAALDRGLAVESSRRFANMDDLLVALERDDWSRRSLPLAIVAVLVFALLAWGRTTTKARISEVPPSCAGAGAAIDAVWSEASRRSLQQGFVASGHAHADAIAEQVERGLDDYAGRWRAAAEDNCAATRVRGLQSEALMDARARCLVARRTELGALVEILARADAETIDQALPAIENLPSLRACAPEQVLTDGLSLPDDEAMAARVTQARADLAGVRASLDTGRFAEAESRRAALAGEVEALGFAPLAAEFAVDDGRVLLRLDRHEPAEAALRRGFFEAVRLGDDDLAVLAAIWLAELEGGRERAEQAELWADHAKALLEREADPDPGVAADLADTMSWNAYARGDFERAHAEAARGLALLDDAGLDAPMRRVDLLLDMGVAAYARGDLALAERGFEGALTLTTRTVGRDNAKSTGPLNNLAFTYLAQGQPEAARTLLEESVASREREFGEEHAAVGLALSNLADVELELGDARAALDAAARSHRILLARRGPESTATLLAQQRLGLAHGLLGEHDQALEVLQAARAIAAAEPAPDPILVAELDGDLAVVHAAAGDSGGSRKALARMAPGQGSAGTRELAFVARYAISMQQAAIARTLLEALETAATADPPQDAAGRRRLAEARMWHAELLRPSDPEAARALLAAIDDADLEGAPALRRRLATLRR